MSGTSEVYCSHSRTQWLIVALLLLLTVLHFSCTSGSPTSPGSPDEILSLTWYLTRIESSQGTRVPDPGRIYSVEMNRSRETGFDEPIDIRISVTADCNGCSGRGRIGPGDELRLGFGCTEGGCEGDVLGSYFTFTLLYARHYRCYGDLLIIQCRHQGQVSELFFERP